MNEKDNLRLDLVKNSRTETKTFLILLRFNATS